MQPPEPVVACLLDFLAASADRAAGERLLDLIDPAAIVPFQGGLVRAGDLDRQAYAAARSALSPPAFEWVEAQDWWDDRVLLARVRANDRELSVTAGFAGGKLSWIGLAPPTPDAAIAHANALAELAAGPGWTAETWLERAHQRLIGREEPPLQTLPGTRFACHGTGACCRNAMAISLPATAQALVDALPWERIAPELAGTRLAPRPDGLLLLKRAHERCRFLDDQTRCRLHLALGRPVFAACTVYPFAFARTPDGVAVTASSGCGSARQGLGPLLTERASDLYERLYLDKRLATTDAYRLTRDQEVPWETFRDMEARVLAVLDGPGTLSERLLAAARLLEGDAPPRPPMDALAQAAAAGMLGALTAGHAAPHPRHADLREAEGVAHVLKNLIFAKKASFTYDLLTAVNAAALLYMMALSIQSVLPPGPLPESFWEVVGQLPTHAPGFSIMPDQDAGAPLTGGSMREPGYVAWLLPFAD